MRALAAAVFPLLATTALSAQSVPPVRVRVLLSFEHPASRVSIGEMQRRAGDLLLPLGFSLAWEGAASFDPSPSPARRVRVSFVGRCRSQTALDWGDFERAPKLALGLSLVEKGHVQPFAEVRCNTIREMLRFDPTGLRRVVRENEYGRALGGVLAHELYHILLDAPEHQGSTGARATHSPYQLLSSDFSFVASPAAERLPARVKDPLDKTPSPSGSSLTPLSLH